MVQTGIGRMVNTSITAFDGGGTFCNWGYPAAKAAVLGLSTGGARELGRVGSCPRRPGSSPGRHTRSTAESTCTSRVAPEVVVPRDWVRGFLCRPGGRVQPRHQV